MRKLVLQNLASADALLRGAVQSIPTRGRARWFDWAAILYSFFLWAHMHIGRKQVPREFPSIALLCFAFALALSFSLLLPLRLIVLSFAPALLLLCSSSMPSYSLCVSKLNCYTRHRVTCGTRAQG